MAQYVIAADVVSVLFQHALVDEVYGATEKALQFAGHLQQVHKAPVGVRLEVHQHIDVAVGAEVVAQGGAEYRQLAYAPTPAKCLYSLACTLIRNAIVLTPPRFVRNGIIPIFRVFATKVLNGRKRGNGEEFK